MIYLKKKVNPVEEREERQLKKGDSFDGLFKLECVCVCVCVRGMKVSSTQIEKN